MRLVLITLAALLTLIPAAAADVTLTVAPGAEGAQYSGLAEARDAIRQMKQQGGLPGPVHVVVRGGVYRISEPVIFTPEDSGTAGAPIFYEAAPGERPIISGGRVITGWRQEGALLVADVPEAANRQWTFGALWVNGERRVPARTPNSRQPSGDFPQEGEEFRTLGPVVEKDAGGNDVKSATKFQYRPGDIQNWPDLKDAFVVVFHSWAASILRVKNLDEQNHIVEFTGPARWPFGYWQPDQRYFVEHIFAGLDQPGEWYLNRETGKLYYVPLPGEDMSTAQVVAPVAGQLVLLEGRPAEGKFVENVHFSGLAFHHTDYKIEPEGHSDAQAAVSVPAAIHFTGARNCSIKNCEIAHTGTYGAWFRTGSVANLMQHCELFDLGAGGVRIGETENPASENEAVSRITVDNCFMHDGGGIFREAVGAFIARSSYNTLSHNEICDFRYSGVSVGWSWGYDASSANHNAIEYNRIHDCGRGQLNDMGAIYTLGVSPGTVLRGNLMHDIISHPRLYGGWGIYFDEGSTGIVAEKNIVYNTSTGTFHQHYGKENVVRNNILAYSHIEQLIRSRDEEHLSFTFENNIVYFNNGRLLGSTWKNGNYRLDKNVYWDELGQESDFAGMTFDEWKAKGYDVNSVIADPLFVDPHAADFRLKPESPAFALGFEAFDLSNSGLYGEPEWVQKPRLIPREPFTPPAPPSPDLISDDFESTPAGTAAAGATTSEEAPASIRVTAEAAASGKQSLKFQDAPGLQHAYDPHLIYQPRLRAGVAVGSFNVRVEPGAVFLHEWRDNSSPYRIGPSIWIDAAGKMTARGKELLTVPLGQWVGIRIECGMGRKADGKYKLEVKLPDQPPQSFDLPLVNDQFSRLEWFGFLSNAAAAAAIYVDDVKLGAE